MPDRYRARSLKPCCSKPGRDNYEYVPLQTKARIIDMTRALYKIADLSHLVGVCAIG